MEVVGAGHEGKYIIIPSEMPELIRVSFGCELTSYQTSGTLSCNEALLNNKEGLGADAYSGQPKKKARV